MRTVPERAPCLRRSCDRGFDYLVGGHGGGSTSFGNATILLYLAVTFTVQRPVVITRAQHRAIQGQAEATGLA